jgi:hypothetical protein
VGRFPSLGHANSCETVGRPYAGQGGGRACVAEMFRASRYISYTYKHEKNLIFMAKSLNVSYRVFALRL